MAVVTRTLKTSGGDYTSPATWESTEQTDLVAAGDQHVLECYTGTYSVGTLLGISGWTTDPTHYITVKAAAGHEHGGVLGAGVIFQSTTASGIAMSVGISIDYIDLTISVVNGGAGNCISVSSSPRINLDRIIIRGSGTAIVSGTGTAFLACTGYVHNTLIYNIGTGLYFSPGIVANNCTAIACEFYGVNLGFAGSHVFKNVVVFGSGDTDFKNIKGASANFNGSSNNASEDATAPGTDSITGITSAVFENYAGLDFTPSSAGGLLDSTGVDLSGSFTDDIAQGTRTTPWDIGAYISPYVVPITGGGLGYRTHTAFPLVSVVARNITT